MYLLRKFQISQKDEKKKNHLLPLIPAPRDNHLPCSRLNLSDRSRKCQWDFTGDARLQVTLYSVLIYLIFKTA